MSNDSFTTHPNWAELRIFKSSVHLDYQEQRRELLRAGKMGIRRGIRGENQREGIDHQGVISPANDSIASVNRWVRNALWVELDGGRDLQPGADDHMTLISREVLE